MIATVPRANVPCCDLIYVLLAHGDKDEVVNQDLVLLRGRRKCDGLVDL